LAWRLVEKRRVERRAGGAGDAEEVVKVDAGGRSAEAASAEGAGTSIATSGQGAGSTARSNPATGSTRKGSGAAGARAHLRGSGRPRKSASSSIPWPERATLQSTWTSPEASGGREAPRRRTTQSGRCVP